MCDGEQTVQARQAIVQWSPVCSEPTVLSTRFEPSTLAKGHPMNSIVYIVGLVVIVLAILGFIGLR